MKNIGKYKIIKKLDSGGFGAVYLCYFGIAKLPDAEQSESAQHVKVAINNSSLAVNANRIITDTLPVGILMKRLLRTQLLTSHLIN